MNPTIETWLQNNWGAEWRYRAITIGEIMRVIHRDFGEKALDNIGCVKQWPCDHIYASPMADGWFWWDADRRCIAKMPDHSNLCPICGARRPVQEQRQEEKGDRCSCVHYSEAQREFIAFSECQICGGTGWQYHQQEQKSCETCPVCHGKGTIQQACSVVCNLCHGTGKPQPSPSAFPPPPPGEQWHNPGNLTPEQVGVKDGWRLALKSEVRHNSTLEFKCDGWQGHWTGRWCCCDSLTTYRTKEPLPKTANEQARDIAEEIDCEHGMDLASKLEESLPVEKAKETEILICPRAKSGQCTKKCKHGRPHAMIRSCPDAHCSYGLFYDGCACVPVSEPVKEPVEMVPTPYPTSLEKRVEALEKRIAEHVVDYHTNYAKKEATR